MSSELPFILIGVLVLGLLITVIIVRKVQKSPKDKSVFKLKGKDSGTYKDVEYEYKYTSQSQYSQASFKITVNCPAEGKFKLTKQNGFDRFFERLGLTRQLKTGYDDFDDLFYVNSDDDDFTAAYFTSPGKRQAAIEIYNKGFKLISLNGKVIEVKKEPVKKKAEITEELIQEVVAQLIILTKDVPENVVPSVIVKTGWKGKRAAAFIIPTLLGIAGVVAMILGLTRYKPLDPGLIFLDSLWYSTSALFGFTWLAVIMIRGRSSSHHEFMLIVVISLVSFLLAGFGGELYLNGYLDQGEPTKHSVVILAKKTKKEKSGREYRAYVESWREGRKHERFGVSKNIYRKIVPHQTMMRVTTKPGKFGFEWVVWYGLNESKKVRM